jgi:hypothetical protein
MFVPCIIRRRRNNQQYALICTTPLFYTQAPTCFIREHLRSFWVTWNTNRMGGISYNTYCNYQIKYCLTLGSPSHCSLFFVILYAVFILLFSNSNLKLEFPHIFFVSWNRVKQLNNYTVTNTSRSVWIQHLITECTVMCTLLCVYSDCHGFYTNSTFFIFSCLLEETFRFGLVMQVAYIFFNSFCISLYPIALDIILL